MVLVSAWQMLCLSSHVSENRYKSLAISHAGRPAFLRADRTHIPPVLGTWKNIERGRRTAIRQRRNYKLQAVAHVFFAPENTRDLPGRIRGHVSHAPLTAAFPAARPLSTDISL